MFYLFSVNWQEPMAEISQVNAKCMQESLKARCLCLRKYIFKHNILSTWVNVKLRLSCAPVEIQVLVVSVLFWYQYSFRTIQWERSSLLLVMGSFLVSITLGTTLLVLWNFYLNKDLSPWLFLLLNLLKDVGKQFF